MEKIIGIYKITSPSGRVYIGQSVDIYKRWRKYKSLNCKKQVRLYNSFLKYGVCKHEFDILLKCTEFQLNVKERYYQEFFNAIDDNIGLNCIYTKTTEKRQSISKETRLKMSISRGNKQTTKGNKHTIETKLKISFSKKNDFHTQKTKEKMSISHKGKKHSSIQKERMSESRIGNKNRNKIILDLNTGVFYYSAIELSNLLKKNASHLTSQLRGCSKNKTSYIYV